MPKTQARVTCPVCRTPFPTEVHAIINVADEPEGKRNLLRGRLNETECPNCKNRFIAPVPILYHDGSKEFLAIFFPPQAPMAENERQRVIGDLTNRLINSLPQEQRKGYLLNPKQFLTMSSLADAILMADGLSQEELNAQRKRLTLLNQILARARDEASIKTLAKEFDDQLDANFFAMMEAVARDALNEGNQQMGEGLLGLRMMLMRHTTLGKRYEAQQKAVESLGPNPTREQLLEKVIQAHDDGVVGALVLAARPLMDYIFFQQLTERAEQEADREEGRRLERLRDRILELTTFVDSASQMAMEQAANTLNEMLESADIAATIREHADEIDETFLNFLALNMQQAQQGGDRALLEQLRRVWVAVNELMDESAPPDVRLIRQVLRQPYPDGTRQFLMTHRADLTPEVLNTMQQIAKEMEPQDKETARRLRNIHSQAMLLA